jgi:membrane-anchored glycerophosphoryl diester phosphodiesterase (GDPDase)
MENTSQPRNYRFLPTVGDSYGNGWELMKTNFLELLLVVVIYSVASFPVAIGRIGVEAAGLGFGGIMLGLFSMAYGLFIVGPLSYGMALVFLKVIRGEKFDIADLFECFKSNYLDVVLANLLVGAIIIAGIFVFIIPGIIFACKLAFVPYLIMDKKLEVIEAVKTSWNMTRGHALTIFLMGLLSIPIVILGLLMLLVGVIPASMWIEGAFASIYHSVDKKLNNGAEAEPEIISQ